MSDTQRPSRIRGDNRSLLELWLASIPCVSSGCKPPADAPLTPEEADKISEYLATRTGPASNGRNRTTSSRADRHAQ